MTHPLLDSLLSAAPDAQAAMLTRLGFAVDEDPDGPMADLLRQAAQDHLPSLLGPLITLSHQFGGGVAQILAQALHRHQATPQVQHTLAQKTLNTIDEDALSLDPVAIAAAEIIVIAALNDQALLSEQSSLSAFNRLIALYHRNHDLPPALALCERMGAARKTAQLPPSPVLMSLHAATLGALGRQHEAIKRLEQVIALAQQQGWNLLAFSDDLINLAAAKSALGEPSSALYYNQMALDLMRDQAEFQGEYVAALTNHAAFQMESGQVEASLATTASLLPPAEALAARDPGLYMGRWIDALINASYIYSTAGQHGKAEQASLRASAELKDLTAPQQVALGSRVFVALSNCANDLVTQGRTTLALEQATQAAEQAEVFLAAAPVPPLQEAVETYATYCTVALAATDYPAARKAGERAYELAQGLDEAAFLDAIITILPNLSDAYAALGADQAAREAARQGHALICEQEQMAAQGGGPTPDPDLSIALRTTYATRLSDQGQFSQAIALLREGTALLSSPTIGPSSIPAHHLTHLANALMELDDLDGALEAIEQALARLDDLATYDQAWADEERPTALYTYGKVLWERGAPEQALSVLDRLVTLNRRRWNDDHVGALEDLISSLDFAAVVLNALGHRQEAKQATDEALSLLGHPALGSPDHRHYDKAHALLNAAAVAYGHDDLDQALAYQQQSLDTLAAIAQKGHKERRLEINGLTNAAAYLDRRGDLDQALTFAAQAFDLAQPYAAERESDAAPLLGALTSYGRLLGKAGQVQQSAEMLHRALTLIEQSGDNFWRGLALFSLAQAQAAQQDYSATFATLTQAMQEYQQRLEMGLSEDLDDFAEAIALLFVLLCQAPAPQADITPWLPYLDTLAKALAKEPTEKAALRSTLRHAAAALKDHSQLAARWPELFSPYSPATDGVAG